jgi:hypothetical protein
MAARQPAPCLRCNQMIDTNEAAIVADIRLRAVGIEETVRSSQASVCICVTCTDLIAKGDAPPQRTQPLNYIVYEQIKDMVTNDPTFTLLSWLELRKEKGLGAANFVEPKVLKAWNDFRRTLALPQTLERPGGEEPPKRLKEAS